MTWSVSFYIIYISYLLVVKCIINSPFFLSNFNYGQDILKYKLKGNLNSSFSSDYISYIVYHLVSIFCLNLSNIRARSNNLRTNEILFKLTSFSEILPLWKHLHLFPLSNKQKHRSARHVQTVYSVGACLSCWTFVSGQRLPFYRDRLRYFILASIMTYQPRDWNNYRQQRIVREKMGWPFFSRASVLFARNWICPECKLRIGP